METKQAGHTTAPWEVSKDAVPEYIFQATVYSEPGSERVATVFGSEANAQLIAAAPELLEACKAAYEFIGTRFYAGRDNGKVYGQLSDAIAKATVTP